MSYTPRRVDKGLAEMLGGLPAVSLEGPKGVGKTKTASRFAKTTIALDDPEQLEFLTLDPGRLLTVPYPVLVDEWQLLPRSWDMVRRAVDDGARPGSFVLTGSATPRERTHSGAGRIVRLRMRPMSFDERQLATPTVSFECLMADEPAPIEGHSSVELTDYADEIVRSGFPGIRGRSGRQLNQALDGYIARVVEHDFAETGHVVRRPEALRSWLIAYAAATGSTATYEAILNATTPGVAEKPMRDTTIAYRDTLTRLWILDQVPAWVGSRNRLASLTQTPKHYLADPALAARLLGVGAGALIEKPRPQTVVVRDGPLLGALFEHLVVLTVRVHAEALGMRTLHLRTKGGGTRSILLSSATTGRCWPSR